MVPPLLFAYNYGVAKYGKLEDKKEFSTKEEDLHKTLEKIFT